MTDAETILAVSLEGASIDEIVQELQRRRAVLEEQLPRMESERLTISCMLVAAGVPTLPGEAAPGPARESDPPPAPAPPAPSPPAPAGPANPLGDGGLRALAGTAPAPEVEECAICGVAMDAVHDGHAHEEAERQAAAAETGAPPAPNRVDRRVRRDRVASDEAVARVLAATALIWRSPTEILSRTDPPVSVTTFRRAMTRLVETGQVESNGERTQRRRYRRVSIEGDVSPRAADDASPVAVATDDASNDVAQQEPSPDPGDDTRPRAAITPPLPASPRARPRPVPTNRSGGGHVGAHGADLSPRVRREMEREQRDADERAKEPPRMHDADSLEGRILASLEEQACAISALSTQLDESGAIVAMTVRELEREGRIERMQDGKYRRIGA